MKEATEGRFRLENSSDIFEEEEVEESSFWEILVLPIGSRHSNTLQKLNLVNLGTHAH